MQSAAIMYNYLSCDKFSIQYSIIAVIIVYRCQIRYSQGKLLQTRWLYIKALFYLLLNIIFSCFADIKATIATIQTQKRFYSKVYTMWWKSIV